MKMKSFGLEVDVEITSKELDELEYSPLTTKLKFRKCGADNQREIPASLVYWPEQKREFKMDILRGGTESFWDAQKLIFIINPDFYYGLKERGYFGQRFYVSGRFEVFVIDFKKP